MAAAQNEDGGIDLLKPYLLFDGEDKDDENGICGIVSRDKINLASEFLPLAPNGDILIAQGGQLSRPQPDTAIGYITFQFARKSGVNLVTKFTEQEDVWLTNYRLTTFMHFPFLTSQWKLAAGSETFHQAENQAARDGSTIVNHLHDLFYEAYNRKPTAIEASHVSVTCGMQAVQAWIHWREETEEEGVQHYMRSFARAFLCDVSQLQEVRSVLWNVLEYSMGPRLSNIKAALPLWWKNSGSKGQTRGASVSSPSVASSSVYVACPYNESIKCYLQCDALRRYVLN
ncbi:hypothetical protein EJ04DRAFT_547798 [Polyplosphaeria fusca]|uniref:DUF7924 domain-containing protein n=1 Tax=Polyplosphaeria fusca TaxID=682080 RepID=A0A9P4R9F5_9PLEO|nr:hypothetical protein EJ04DRAFT_547798 [Polyplosphaeria fusca]